MASDMRLNDKPIAKDGAYIYAEAADGSQVKISKADLAAVVAENNRIRHYVRMIEGTATFEFKGPYGIAIITSSDATTCALYALYGSGHHKIYDLETSKISIDKSSTWGYFVLTNNSDKAVECVITVISHT